MMVENDLAPDKRQTITDHHPDYNYMSNQSLRNIGITLRPLNTTGLILGLHPANERRRYNVTPSLIGQAQT